MKKKFELNDTLFLIDGEYYLVDKEVKIVKGDWCYDSKHNQIFQWNGEGNLLKITHKVTASTKSLEGIHHFSIEDENFSKLCSVSYDKLIKRITEKVNPYDYRFGFLGGYKAAKAKQYTEDDVRKAFKAGLNFIAVDPNYIEQDTNEYIQSLQPQIESIEVEYEYIHDDTVPYPKTKGTKPKLNSKGELIIKVNHER